MVNKLMFMPILELRKKPKVLAAVIFVAFVSGTLVTHLASGSGERDPTCGRFIYNEQCDLSPTLHLIIGDIVVGGVLAMLFYYLTHRNQIRIDKIVESQEALRIRRKDYAVQHLKNLFQLIIFTMSVTKKSVYHYNLTLKLKDDERQVLMQSVALSELRRDEAKLGRVLQSVRSLLVAADDVLEPDVVNRVEGVCNYLGEISVDQKVDGMMEFPKYDVCRMKVHYLIQLLQTYSCATRSFKDIEEPYGTSTIVSELDLAREVTH